MELNERHKGRFPFFMLFLIAIVIGSEYFYGTLQIQSTLRSTNAHHHPRGANDNHEVLDKMASEKRLVMLEKRLSSLESSLRAHVMNGGNNEAITVNGHEEVLSGEESSREPLLSGDDESSREPFCVRWKENRDEWWTHHPDWEVSKENRTHYCFAPIQDPEKAAVFRKLYRVQFKTGDCSKVITKPMWSSGWGADFENVVDGLKHAYDTGIPVQMHVIGDDAWHYAGKKDGSRPVCESKDMYCYFLPLTKCPANPKRPYEGEPFMADVFEMHQGVGRWLLEYATRKQTWLRREVFKFSRRVRIKTPCTAIHVRRTDIVLHVEFARKYRKIEEYVKALDEGTKNILLLTDDQNAVDEALTLFPEYKWQYLERDRHRGIEGGWENQIPSDDPKLEVIILLSIFRLVRKCSSLIHTQSNFAKVLQGEMQDVWGKDFHRVDLDEGYEYDDIYNENNTLSANLSLPFRVKKAITHKG